MSRTRVGACGAVVVAVLLAACTSSPVPPVGAVDAPAPSGSASPSVTPERPLEPLVVVVHRASPRRGITTRALEARTDVLMSPAAVRAGVAAAGSRLPSDRAVVRAVGRDRRLIGLARASAVGPSVRALRLDGIDPLLTPRRYPLQAPGREPGTPTTMFAAGDIMLSRTVHEKMVALGDFTAPFASTYRRSRAADIAIANLETSMSASHAPLGEGTRFVSDDASIAGLRKAGFDMLSLANNHTGDFGGTVLVETVRLLRRAGIRTAGAGANDARARRPAIVEANGVRFAFLAFNAIVGTPAAGPDTSGATRIQMRPWFPFSRTDLDAFIEDVAAARAVADVVIVFPHWGTEYREVPDASMVEVGHAIIEAGADMIVGTHPHWVQSAEMYRGRLIVYSLGNFVFDQMWSRRTREGAALEMVFWGDELKRAEFVPVVIDDYHRPRFASGREGARILARIWPRKR